MAAQQYQVNSTASLKEAVLNMRIRNYRQVEAGCKPGQKVMSRPHALINDTEWYVGFYPKGESSGGSTAEGVKEQDEEGFVSLFLFLHKDPHQSKGGRLVRYSFQLVKADSTVEVVKSESEKSFVLGGLYPAWGSAKVMKREDLLEKKNGYLQNDGSLLLQCRIIFENEFVGDAMDKKMLSLFHSSEFSDITLKTSSGKLFKTHQFILRMCPVFARMMADSTDKEEPVKMDDGNDEAVEAMLHYLYTSKVESHHRKGLLLFDLLIMADKYELLDLRAFCLSQLETKVDADNILSVVIYLDEQGEFEKLSVLKTTAQEFICENWKDLKEKGLLTEINAAVPQFTVDAVANFMSVLEVK